MQHANELIIVCNQAPDWAVPFPITAGGEQTGLRIRRNIAFARSGAVWRCTNMRVDRRKRMSALAFSHMRVKLR